MNKKDRKVISGWIDKLEEIKSEIEDMQTEEECKFDNLPEGIQESERGERMIESIECLGDSVSSIEEAIDSLNEAME